MTNKGWKPGSEIINLAAFGHFKVGHAGSVSLHPEAGYTTANGKVAPIPRHREIKEGTVRAVCRQLEIPKP